MNLSFTRATVAFLALVFSLSACGRSAPPDATSPGFSVRDSVGIEIVVNSLSTLGNAPPLALSQVLRIGMLDGPEEYQFGSVRAVREAPDGKVFVLDSQANVLRVFDARGEFLRRIGREGDGPGEFNYPYDAAVAGDTALVADLRYIHQFVGGESLLSMRIGDRPPAVERIRHVPVGWLAATRARGFDWVAGSTPRSVPVQDSIFIGRINVDAPEMQLQDTVLRLGLNEFYLVGSAGWMVTPLFGRDRQFAIATDGRIYFTPGDDYVVDVLDVTGAHLRRIIAEVEKVPVTRRDVDAYLQRSREKRGPSPTGESALWLDEVPPALESLPLLPFRPIPGRILAAPGGRILVQRLDLGPAPEEPWEGGTTWDLFDPDGRIVGRLVLPQTVRPMELSDTALWTVTRDELDVQYVVRYEIREA